MQMLLCPWAVGAFQPTLSPYVQFPITAHANSKMSPFNRPSLGLIGVKMLLVVFSFHFTIHHVTKVLNCISLEFMASLKT